MTDFQYTIKAHPTTYAGVNFRSRLEATWAAFFDLCGWEWEYEPIDLDGWSPDFVLRRSIAVEIKPIFTLAELPDTYLSRITGSGWGGPIWVLGAMIDGTNNSSIGWSIAKGGTLWPSREQRIGGNGDLVAITDANGVVTVDYITESAGGAYELLDEAWAVAKNTTQWKPTNA